MFYLETLILFYYYHINLNILECKYGKYNGWIFILTNINLNILECKFILSC